VQEEEKKEKKGEDDESNALKSLNLDGFLAIGDKLANSYPWKAPLM
jgi:hypothetical protein